MIPATAFRDIPWTYCIDRQPEAPGRYEVAVVTPYDHVRTDRRFLEWFVGGDGSRGWLGELDCIAYAWRPMEPADELPAPRRRDFAEWPSLRTYLETLGP